VRADLCLDDGAAWSCIGPVDQLCQLQRRLRDSVSVAEEQGRVLQLCVVRRRHVFHHSRRQATEACERQLLEQATAVVVHDDHGNRNAGAASEREAGEVVQEADVADEDGHRLLLCARAAGCTRHDAVDSIGSALAEDVHVATARPAERVDLAHREAVAEHQQGAVRDVLEHRPHRGAFAEPLVAVGDVGVDNGPGAPIRLAERVAPVRHGRRGRPDRVDELLERQQRVAEDQLCRPAERILPAVRGDDDRCHVGICQRVLLVTGRNGSSSDLHDHVGAVALAESGGTEYCIEGVAADHAVSAVAETQLAR
jgi:hypothetical protein